MFESNPEDMSISNSSSKHSDLWIEEGGGLARYRSAPSSLMAALLDSNSSSGDESEALFSALLDPKSNHTRSGKSEFDGTDRNGTLMRQSSSPAGFFNGFGIMEGDIGSSSYRIQNHGKATSNHMSFSASASSSSRFMPSIPENGHQRSCTSAATGNEFEAFTHDSCNGSLFNTTLKRNRDGEVKMFPGNEDTAKNSSGLVHHLSLPKNSSEMAEVENYLQFQQDATTVRCQMRAKRGCATHPRSIAERVRRTKISEKMKKLQDLFPNLDKQTNTADMLDMAVDYIKELQKQVQMLTDAKAKCMCSSKLSM